MHEESPRKQLLYWRRDWFHSLKEIAREAAQSSAWTGYAMYCAELERGLRKRALLLLDRFVSRMERASFADRKAFVSWLLSRIDQSLRVTLWHHIHYASASSSQRSMS